MYDVFFFCRNKQAEEEVYAIVKQDKKVIFLVFGVNYGVYIYRKEVWHV